MPFTKNTQGAILMTFAMAGFTCNDALTKSLTDAIPVSQIIMVRGVIMTLLVYIVALKIGARPHFNVLRQPMVVARVLLECLAALCFLTALSHLPLGNISSIMQSLPLAVTLGAALFLREPVGWRRWSAITVGFIGVLIILRPGPEGFSSAALFAVAAVFLAAARDLVTKKIGANTASINVTLFTAAGNALMGGLLIVPYGGWQPMPGYSFGILTAAAMLLFVGHQSIVLAMRTAEVSFVAPFRYLSLLWAIGLGMLMFNEKLDPWMVTGATIVIGSGLYTFYRENKRKSALLIGQESQPGSPL
ncbi:DMT family transporter [Agrobacterium sp. ES01]|uniref:DMT family transporter n=1 Tax=Agrobacterium sp. ES01 TaxID=3420714 RepID=UPI003D0FFB8E